MYSAPYRIIGNKIKIALYSVTLYFVSVSLYNTHHFASKYLLNIFCAFFIDNSAFQLPSPNFCIPFHNKLKTNQYLGLLVNNASEF